MGKFWLGCLKTFGLAYWVTVEAYGTDERSSYCFGPFASANAAIAAQERCCHLLLQTASEKLRIRSIRVSMER